MTYYGPHLQDNVIGWRDAIATSAMRLVKLFVLEMAAEARAVRPDVTVVGRHWCDDVNQDGWLQMALAGQADQAADQFILRFKDSLSTNRLDYFESLNEQYPTGNPAKLQAAIQFDRAFIRRLAVHCPGVKPVVMCAAIGNPDFPDFQRLMDLARETQAAGGAFGYHAYWTACQGASFVDSDPHWKNLHGRWDEIDRYLVGRGIRVRWLLGEAGPTGCNPDGYNPGVNTGWRHPDTLNANLAKLLDDLDVMERRCRATLAAQEGRLLGYTLFTSKIDPGQWQYFQIAGAALQAIAQHSTTFPSTFPPSSPGDDPAPPPDPGGAQAGGGSLPRYTVARDLDYLNVRSSPEILPNNVVGHLQAGEFGWFQPDQEITTADGNAWLRWGQHYVARRYAGRTYCVPLVSPEPAFTLAWPTNYRLVTQPFGARPEVYARYGLPGHEGIDIQAPTSASVKACADGQVYQIHQTSDGWHNYGIHVRLQHAGGYKTIYAHLGATAVVVGQNVKRGQVIGYADNTGNSTGAHLHLTLKKDGATAAGQTAYPGDIIDPTPYLA